MLIGEMWGVPRDIKLKIPQSWGRDKKGGETEKGRKRERGRCEEQRGLIKAREDTGVL